MGSDFIKLAVTINVTFGLSTQLHTNHQSAGSSILGNVGSGRADIQKALIAICELEVTQLVNGQKMNEI